jgi:hypothetical protein
VSRRKSRARRRKPHDKVVVKDEGRTVEKIQVGVLPLLQGALRFNPYVWEFIREEDAATASAAWTIGGALVLTLLGLFGARLFRYPDVLDPELYVGLVIIAIGRILFLIFWLGLLVAFELWARVINKKFTAKKKILLETPPEGVFRVAAFTYAPYSLVYLFLTVTVVVAPALIALDLAAMLVLIVLTTVVSVVVLKHETMTALLFALFSVSLPQLIVWTVVPGTVL